MERMNRRVVDYIVERTGIDRETVVKILRAKEEFLAREIERILNTKPIRGGV